MVKYIFITWWVCSSLWKWIAASSIGAILKSSGYKVFMQKLDPYLNIDPWTMSPFQHWEVFVTEDWAETDLDLWHYERFIDTNLSKASTITTWKIYQNVLDKERKWTYKWWTIQIIPHITNEIISSIKKAWTQSETDFLIVEIWWTVWDIEWEPYLESIRQMRFELWKERTFFVHLTLLPYLSAARELKTKPTQLSVKALKSVWITPDIILTRADRNVSKWILEKISMFCDVEKNAVIPAKTLDSIYKFPLYYEKYNMSVVLAKKFWMKYQAPKMKEFQKYVDLMENTKLEINIWLAVKYNWLDDAYISVIEALKTAWYHNNRKVNIIWIDTEKIEQSDSDEFNKIKDCHWICVPWGFWIRGIEWKVIVAKYCRENKLPYFGLCLWSQILAIEFARHIWIKWATSEEFKPKAKHKIVAFLEGQSSKKDIWWTLRLWSWPCKIIKGTIASKAYKTELIHERHRHRYEFNNKYKKQLESKWLVISWTSPNGKLMEIVEIKDHPFMLWTQFHPEFKSRPYKPHPLFNEFIKSVIKK